MSQNPLFIPKNFRRKERDGETLYCSRKIRGMNIRFIEYRNKDGLLKRVGVWGICRELKPYYAGFVALDEKIDFKTMSELKGPVKEMYSEGTEITFF